MATSASARQLPTAPSTPVLANYVTEHVLAQELGVSLRTLRRWALNREGPPTAKIVKKTYYNRTQLERWLESRTQVPVRPCTRSRRAA